MAYGPWCAQSIRGTLTLIVAPIHNAGGELSLNRGVWRLACLPIKRQMGEAFRKHQGRGVVCSTNVRSNGLGDVILPSGHAL
jgi:hypothetical protein